MARRCGYCYDYGHNQRTCEALTASIKRQTECTTDGWTKNYYIKKYIQRVGTMPDGTEPTGDYKQVKKTSTRRQCGWCKANGWSSEESSYGHNKQTCPNRKEWAVEQTRLTQKLRAVIRSRARTFGVGIGTLVKDSQYCYDHEQNFGKHELVGIIEKIDWQSINSTNHYAEVTTVNWINHPSKKLTRQSGFALPRRLFPTELADNSWRIGANFEIIAKSSNPLATCPKDWEQQIPTKLCEPS